MSGKSKKRREITLFVVAFWILTHHPCRSVSLGKLEYDFTPSKVQESKWIRLDHKDSQHLPNNKVTIDQKQHRRKWSGLRNTSPELTFYEKEAVLRQLQENGIHLKSLSWSSGHISPNQKSPTYKSGKGYQSDFTGFGPVQGEILGVSSDTTHLSEWLAMRPLVHCDQNVMTFTASGGGFTNLFVGRDGGAPISLFDLPSICGYEVKTKWGDLEMTVPYDACYILEQDGNIVLPLEWWGNNLMLSCPTWSQNPAPTVYCSPYGMVVQIVGREEDLPKLGFKVNGRWGPLMTEECASLFSSHDENFLFFIPTTASCITTELGVHLWLIIDELEYTLSCPEFPFPPPSSPSEPDPVSPAPPPSPSPPLDPIYQHPDFPQIYPPAPQLPKLPAPTADAPPGPQPQHHAHSLVPYFEGGGMKQFKSRSTPVKTPSPAAPNFNVGHDKFVFPPNFPVSQDHSQMYNPYAPYSYKEHPTASTVSPSPPQMPNFQHLNLNAHFLQVPYHLGLQTPATPSPIPQAVPPQPLPPVNPPFPPYIDVSYNPYHFYHQTSGNLVSPSSPVKPSFPQTVPEPHKHCFPYGDKLCPDYFSPYYPYHHPPHSPVYPPVQQPTVPAHPRPQAIQHHCLGDRIFVRLPFAHPDSIQVKVQTNVWHFLSNMPTFCQYKLHWSDGAGIILDTPLSGCHTYSKFNPSTSLSLRYWDTSLAHFRTGDVRCLEQTITPPAPPLEPPKVSCSAHHMIIEFPAWSISEISVKDLYGNKIKLQDVSKDCGYSTSLDKDGKISLSIPLHLHCHMTLQGSVYTIIIVYTMFHGTRETQFSCPASAAPTSAQECNLPSNKRLPCGPASVSQHQCTSMGCCFSTHPAACYYPMDECTADGHFVFSVPASLTKPPLSLPLLIAGGNPSCKPERVMSDCALFKVPMDDCGARRMQVGKTVIYILEINNIVHSISLSYGTITRDSPVRLMVECRFLPGSALTVSYMVKTPTLGPDIHTPGAFGVQIRIAKDSEYMSYYPHNHQPLQVLLDTPIYLEVRLLNSPDPSLVLLVHYCIAYPRTGKSYWPLILDGCLNEQDPHPDQAVVSQPNVPVPAQIRRFTVRSFKFHNVGQVMDSNEEIYIMCGTELCSTRHGPCDEGCFAP